MRYRLASIVLLLTACAAPPRPDPFQMVAEDPAPVRTPKVAADPDEQLKKDIDEASEIIVIGRTLSDHLPVVPLDAIGSRNVYGPEDIKQAGARDLNDLVQNIPAISTRPYNGGEASAPSFSMRGLPDDGLTEYIDILIDGVPASPLPYGWTAFSFMPVTPERLFAIDYHRGAHTLRYSPNTVAGVLNFITTPIPLEPTLNVRTTFGNLGFASAMVSGGGQVGDVGLLGTYVNRRGDGYRELGGFDQQDTNVKLRWNIDGERWLATSISYMLDDHKAPGGLTTAEFAANRLGNSRPLNRFDGDRFVADFVYHDQSGGENWWEAYGNLSKTMRHLRAQRPQFGTPDTMLDWTDDAWFFEVGGRFQQTVKLGSADHELYGGVRYHQEEIPHWKIRSEPFPGGPGPLTRDSTYFLNSLSAHIDDTFEPVKNLLVQLGVRLEWVPEASGSDPIIGFDDKQDFFGVFPGIGASYLIHEVIALFANYYEGFRAPQVWGFGSLDTGANLVFEQGRLAEAGVRADEKKSGVHGAITVWRTEYDDFGVFYTGFYENLGRIVANGVDFEIGWDVGRVWDPVVGLVVTGSFTLQDSQLKSGPDAGNQTPYAWKQKAAWRVAYTRDGWLATIGGTYVGDSFSDEANTSTPSPDGTLGVNPSRVIWDARVGKRFELGDKADLELAVGATNIFDKEWYVHSRGGFFGGGLVAGPPLQGYASLDLVMNW